VLLQPVDILNTTFSFNTERAAEIHYWNVWIVGEKNCEKLDSLLLKFQDSTGVHLKKWTLKFKLLYLLNHIAILLKFAEYVVCILICKRCKFGEKICNNSRDIEFFLMDYLRPTLDRL